ncbi:FAD protein-3 [Coleophoma cylindrospora]|uniref:FAD protein-3 n=1 Tax=Coleophoma cylindrospora TaxID=1849047 RepID=A0A3D8RUL7_9HELO|nr:FAD protein-3 [Coleophoma cylindrospora]
MSPIPIKQKIVREDGSKMKIIVVGAGLGGLGAAIALLLAGHDVEVFEAASEIGEVGAGIQILPNSSRVLQSWGMHDMLDKHATKPKQVNFLGWKGNHISHMNFHESASKYPGTFYWDFHRANLHNCLLERAVELGAKLKVNARVQDVICDANGEKATVVLHNGERHTGDLVVGADGINSRLREIMLGREDPPTLTGDLAYRLLLSTKDMLKDPELADLVTNPQVNYWLGPDAHAVNYVLRGGELFNMVLLVPDDMPAGANTLEGNVEEMRALYKDWDPRIPKLLSLCESVYKWRLCIRTGMESWSHPSGTLTMLGDAVHATLPYLASGAGMSLEDGAVLGELFSRRTTQSKSQLLELYQKIRAARTEMVVERGNRQQYLYHLHDGPEQEERDRVMRAGEEGDALAWKDGKFAEGLLGWCCEVEVDKHWPSVAAASENVQSRL